MKNKSKQLVEDFSKHELPETIRLLQNVTIEK